MQKKCKENNIEKSQLEQLKKLLDEAEDDIRNNRVSPIEEFFSEFEKR